MNGDHRWPDGPVTEADLHAWLDGELPADRLAVVEAHLAAHPEDLARLDSYRDQTRLIATAFAPLAALPPVTDERPPMPQAPRHDRPALPRLAVHRRSTAALAAGLALFIAGTATGWLLHNRSAGAVAALPALAADALAAHVVFAAEVRHPVEVGADQEAHLIAWLSRRLGRNLTVPTLADRGFELLGGRLLPGDNQPAAQLMYQDAAGRRITLYARPAAGDGETAFRIARAGKATAFYWKGHDLDWAVAGEADRTELLDLANRVYAQLDAPAVKAH